MSPLETRILREKNEPARVGSHGKWIQAAERLQHCAKASWDTRLTALLPEIVFASKTDTDGKLIVTDAVKNKVQKAIAQMNVEVTSKYDIWMCQKAFKAFFMS